MNILLREEGTVAFSGGASAVASIDTDSFLQKEARLEELHRRLELFTRSVISGNLADNTKRVYVVRIRTFTNALCVRGLDDIFVSLERDFERCVGYFFQNSSYSKRSFDGFITVFQIFGRLNGFDTHDYGHSIQTYRDPDSLSPKMFELFMNTVAATASKRDRCLIQMLTYSSIPIKCVLELRASSVTIRRNDSLETVEISYSKVARGGRCLQCCSSKDCGCRSKHVHVLDSAVADVLLNWLTEVDLSNADSPIFPSRNGVPLSLTAADHAVRSAGWRCGLTVSVAKLRAAARARGTRIT